MFDGFFTSENTKATKRRNWCLLCGLHRKCKTPKFTAVGEGERGILIVGDYPSKSEDNTGRAFSDMHWALLTQVLKEHGLDPIRDCRFMYAVSCCAGESAPDSASVECCAHRVEQEIKYFQPHTIILLGSVSLESYFMKRWADTFEGLQRWRGWCIPERDAHAWVLSTYAPRTVARNIDKKNPAIAYQTVFEQDIRRALSTLNTPFPNYKEESTCVRIIKGDEQIYNAINKIYETPDPLLAFDFEATGLKPHRKGHSIRCVSMCWSDEEAIVFNMPQENTKAFGAFKRVLISPRIRKTAHNMKFEDTWCAVSLNIIVRNWYLCTLIGSHVLDNRPKITGLKWQAYVRFGTPDYSQNMRQYLEASKEDRKIYGANAFNRVYDAPEYELCIYCGVDSLVQYRLARVQERELGLCK